MDLPARAKAQERTLFLNPGSFLASALFLRKALKGRPKEASDYSGKKGITLGIEDHGGITQGTEVCLEIMRRVDSPYAGINLDITHFIPTPTADRYAQITSCIPYATNTHIRDHFDGGTPINMDRAWRLFAEGGYKGFMSVECQGKEDPMTGVPKLMNKVKALCRKYSTTAEGPRSLQQCSRGTSVM